MADSLGSKLTLRLPRTEASGVLADLAGAVVAADAMLGPDWSLVESEIEVGIEVGRTRERRFALELRIVDAFAETVSQSTEKSRSRVSLTARKISIQK